VFVATCVWACRGNGFITDTNIIKKYGLSDANNFFRELVSKPYVHKVCLRASLAPCNVFDHPVHLMCAVQQGLTSRTSCPLCSVLNRPAVICVCALNPPSVPQL
jgi:hypothetical protein